MIKKILTASLGLGMVLATVVPAFAGITIERTGPDSKLDARLNRVKTHSFSLTNTYNLTQAVVSTQTAGDNIANNNTGNGTSGGGNTTANHTSQVDANSVNVDVNMTADTCNCDNNITVNTTGPNSTANAVIDNTKTTSVSVSNSGNVTNTFVSTVNTGGNSASHNTGNGSTLGGDSSIISLITTKLNSVMYKLSM